MNPLLWLAGGVGVGLVLIANAVMPPGRPRDIDEALAALAGSAPERQSPGRWPKALVRHRWVTARVSTLAPDLKLLELTGEQWITKAARSAALAATGAVAMALLFGMGAVVAAGAAVVGVAVGVWSELRWLRARASERREELVDVAQALLTLTTVGLHTSKPMSEIAVDAIDCVGGWPGRVLRQALWEGGNAEQLTTGEALRSFGTQVASSPLRLFGDTVAQGERLHVDPAAVLKRGEQLQVELDQRLVADGGRQREKVIVPIMVFAVVIVAITMMIPMGAAIAQ